MQEQHYQTETEDAPVIVAEDTENVEEETISDVEPATAFLDWFQVKVRQRKRQFWLTFFAAHFLYIFIGFFAIGLLRSLLELSNHLSAEWIIHLNQATLFLMLGAWLGGNILLLYQFVRKPVATVDELSVHGDINLIGPLIDIARTASFQDRRVAYQTLTALLPRLKASDADLLYPKQYQFLVNTLKLNNLRPVSVEFKVAVIQALEQIGDEKALPVVEKLANMRPKNAEQERLRDAARECLPALLQRVDSAKPGHNLLRAAGLNDAVGEVLLRPATDTLEVAPQQLLRATHTDGAPPTL